MVGMRVYARCVAALSGMRYWRCMCIRVAFWFFAFADAVLPLLWNSFFLCRAAMGRWCPSAISVNYPPMAGSPMVLLAVWLVLDVRWVCRIGLMVLSRIFHWRSRLVDVGLFQSFERKPIRFYEKKGTRATCIYSIGSCTPSFAPFRNVAPIVLSISLRVQEIPCALALIYPTRVFLTIFTCIWCTSTCPWIAWWGLQCRAYGLQAYTNVICTSHPLRLAATWTDARTWPAQGSASKKQKVWGDIMPIF